VQHKQQHKAAKQATFQAGQAAAHAAVAVSVDAAFKTPSNQSFPHLQEVCSGPSDPTAGRPGEDAHGGMVSHAQGITNGSLNARMLPRRPAAYMKDAAMAVKDMAARKSTPLLVV